MHSSIAKDLLTTTKCSCYVGESIRSVMKDTPMSPFSWYLGEFVCSYVVPNFRSFFIHALSLYYALMRCYFPSLIDRHHKIPYSDSVMSITVDVWNLGLMVLITNCMIRILFWFYYLFRSRPEVRRHHQRMARIDLASSQLRKGNMAQSMELIIQGMKDQEREFRGASKLRLDFYVHWPPYLVIRKGIIGFIYCNTLLLMVLTIFLRIIVLFFFDIGQCRQHIWEV
eukprot:TRINITY_DN7435_c0_g1_i1.p1 TRINITY_DN7435_c0_g1~~TRINITY_DN7435_c0_g1_i1.p1  ORF type:complete len:226 (-),score=14.08 TRINITY_DN7435_c0_g1_i1:41-718(-)